MKNKKALLLLWGLFIITLSTFSKDYYNSNYKINKSNFSLLVLPIYNNWDDRMNDTLSAKIFQKDTTNISIYDIPSIREIIDTDIFIVEILTKISDKRYKAKELKTFPNLNTIITQPEIEYLRNIFNNPDLVLIPIGFFVRNIGPFNSIGFSKFRLYDLNSGELIFDCTKNLNVNVSGPEGKAYITGGLFSLTFDYFEKKFISKLNNIKE